MSPVLYGSHSLLQGGLLDPGIEPGSPTLQADSLPMELSGKPLLNVAAIKSQILQTYN